MSRKSYSFSFKELPTNLNNSLYARSTPRNSEMKIKSVPKNSMVALPVAPKTSKARKSGTSSSRYSEKERRRLSSVFKKDFGSISMMQLFKAAPLKTTKSTVKSIFTSGKTPLGKAKANIAKSDKIMFGRK